MDSSQKAPATIDEYIAAFPEAVQSRLQAIRETIHLAAPQAAETISYGMPTFRLKQNLVYFSAAKNHIGFYPTAAPIEAFKEQVSPYASSKGTLQFRYDQPIPFDLVAQIVQYRVEQVAKKK